MWGVGQGDQRVEFVCWYDSCCCDRAKGVSGRLANVPGEWEGLGRESV